MLASSISIKSCKDQLWQPHPAVAGCPLLTDGIVSALELVEGATCCAGEVGSYHTPGMKGDGNPVDRKNNYIDQINQFWVTHPTKKHHLDH